ncbi:MAG: DUF1638 domain-containing protein [Rhodobacteraceae bacterium]|nr:DUF1638 domain-containing protein [Paracoccaceae bacterium]
MNGWDHFVLQCLPADLHLRPEKIPDAVEAVVRKSAGKFSDIFVAYADCGTGGLLQKRCDELGVQMIAGPHCYSFFDGNETFEERGEVTSFFLTDFLARQFDAFVWKPMGLDRHPELRDLYFGNYEKLVYLAQTNDPDLDKRSEAAAEKLGLAYERRFTGYGDLASALAPQAKDSQRG